MSETHRAGAEPPRSPGGDDTQSLMDLVKHELALLAKDVQTAAGEIRAQLAAAAEGAKAQAAGLAGTAKSQVHGVVDEQKNFAAERVGGIARVAHRAAEQLEGELPLAASYVREAGAGIDEIAGAIRRQNVEELLAALEDFAEQRPATAFVVSMLAGFALARFVKSSAAEQAVRSRNAASRNAAGRNAADRAAASRAAGAPDTPGATL